MVEFTVILNPRAGCHSINEEGWFDVEAINLFIMSLTMEELVN